MPGERIASQSKVTPGHRVGLESMLWGARTLGACAPSPPPSGRSDSGSRRCSRAPARPVPEQGGHQRPAPRGQGGGVRRGEGWLGLSRTFECCIGVVGTDEGGLMPAAQPGRLSGSMSSDGSTILARVLICGQLTVAVAFYIGMAAVSHAWGLRLARGRVPCAFGRHRVGTPRAPR